MGHFGCQPIRIAWFSLVLPALVVNYMGQGALLLASPETREHPFFYLAPGWALLPLVVLSTMATVIASQAVISGAFSLTRQAVQLGYLPRVDIEHTSSVHIGQIYIPGLNWLLMIACVGLVVGFRSSSNLAAAYGVAVTTDMVFTTILLAVVAHSQWKWGFPATFGMAAGFLVFDLGFWSAGLTKIPSGGWFPLVIAAFVFTLMTTWKTGRRILAARLAESALPLSELTSRIEAENPARVKGTAVYLTRDPSVLPHALVLNLEHNRVLHERIVFLGIVTEDQAYVFHADSVRIELLSPEVYRVTAHGGFAEDVKVPMVLERCRALGLDIDPEQATFFVGRETLLATERPGMAIWRERLFARMARNARRATRYFSIPAHRVVEIGAEIEL